MVRKGRKGKRRKNGLRASALKGAPQLRGVVTRVYVVKPVKPNSAHRKLVRVKLTNGKEVTAAVRGETHTLREHSLVLVKGRGGKVKDLRGIKYDVVRGVLDHTGVPGRKQARSKYGAKRA